MCGISAGHLHTGLAPGQPISAPHVPPGAFQNAQLGSARPTSGHICHRERWKQPSKTPRRQHRTPGTRPRTPGNVSMYWQQTGCVSTASENNQGNAQVQGRDNRCNAERCVETVRYAQLSAESVNYYSIAARVVVSCRESLITSTVKRWEMEGHVAGGGITG